MTNFRNIAAISFRNFIRNSSRYRLLVGALSSAVLVQVLILGSILGITRTIRDKAARYFGGEIVILGYGASQDFSEIPDVDAIRHGVEHSGVTNFTIAERSMYYRLDAGLFYEGNYQKQQRLIGVDWVAEAKLLDSFVFTRGTIPAAGDDDGILISSNTASKLSANMGDRIIVSVTTDSGQKNTGGFVIRGIFDDPSFFGYSSYLSRKALNLLTGNPPERISEIGIFLPPGVNKKNAAVKMLHGISKVLPSYHSIFHNQNQRDAAYHSRNQNQTHRYGIITLDANLAEIQNLLDALAIAAGFLMTLFLLIVAIGISNTHKMLVFERSREIGTMRALGLTRGATLWMFLCEAIYPGISGGIIGLILGIISLESLETIDFSRQEALLIFLERGKIVWNLPLGWIVVVMIITAGASLTGGYAAARRAAYLPPADALRQD